MKKILLYILMFVLISFAIPIIFTIKDKGYVIEKNNEIENEIESQIISYDYKNYSTIKLLHTKDNTIEEIPLDEYLYGVVAAEMPASYEIEALKAQAIVARTYTIYKIENNSKKHDEADICDSSACCQAWISKEDRFSRWEEKSQEENWNKIVNAVNSTKGKIITYEGKPINAFFHSNSGGKTETTMNVWGGDGYPYLQAVATAGEDAYSQYQSEVVITKDEFVKKLEEKYKDFDIDFSKKDAIKVLQYTDSNRVKTIKIGNKELSGVEVRTIFGLKSANFKINIDNNDLKFEVIGYGHGVGMSQTGADAKAKQGSNAEEIIKHFYTGVEIVNI